MIVLTGEGPGVLLRGDQRVRGDSGYLADDEAADSPGRSGAFT